MWADPEVLQGQQGHLGQKSLWLTGPPLAGGTRLTGGTGTADTSSCWSVGTNRTRLNHYCNFSQFKWLRTLAFHLTLTKITYLLCKGKCLSLNSWPPVWLVGCFVTSKWSTDLLVWLNPNQLNRRTALQLYFLLRSEWVFSALTFQA